MANLSLQTYINNNEVKNRINNLLKERSSQFITSIIAAVNNDAKLAECEPKSIITAALTAAAINMPVNNNLGFVYLIPYKNNKTGEINCQLQFGYRSFIQLAMRSGQFRTINVNDVREGEIVENNLLTGEIKFEWNQERDNIKVVGYVAYMELLNGFQKILYMTKEQLKKHGVKFSKSFKYGGGLWKDDFDAMAKKTVIKLLLSKYAPMTVDMQTATLSDQAIIRDDGYEYADNTPVDIDEINISKENERVLKHIAESKTVAQLEEVAGVITDDTQQAYLDKAELLSKEAKNE